MDLPEDNQKDIKLILESVLLGSDEPVALTELRKLFDNEYKSEVIRQLLEKIKEEWTDKSIELVHVSSGWRFQVRSEYQKYLNRLNPQRPPKYSRAVMETLAIIAYRQPVTRGDIEQTRGVVVSPNIIRTLEGRGWIDVVVYRESPGRPALFSTTKRFLDDLGLRSLEDLPPLEELANLVDLEVVPDDDSEG